MWAEVLRLRWLWLVMTVVVTTLFLLQLPHIRFSVDERAFFDKDDPFRLSLEELEARFSKRNTLLIAIAPADNDAFSPPSLEAQFMLTDEMWQLPYVTRVNSLTNYQHIRAEDDDVIIESLVSEVPVSAARAAEIRDIALGENDLAGQLVSHKGHVAAIQISFVLPPENPNAALEVMAAAREIVARTEAIYPGLKAYYTGDIALSATFGQASQEDIITLFPLVLGIMALFSYFFLRSFSAALGVMIVILLSGLMTIGFASWVGIVLTSASASAPTIVLTLAVADSMHLLMSFLHYRQNGIEKKPAMQLALRENVLPITLTTVTTIIGFLSMNASEAPPFRDLGNMVAFGIFTSFWLSLLFLPALMMVLPSKTPKPLPSGKILHAFGPLLFRRAKMMATAVVLLSCLVIVGMGRIELDDDWVTYFDHRYPFRGDAEFVLSNLTGMDVFDYVVSSGEPEGLYQPGYLKKVEQFTQWAAAQEEVTHVSSLIPLFKKLNKNLNGGDPAYERLPESPELAAQYLLLYEMSLPLGQDLNDRMDVAKAAMRVSLTTKGLSSVEIRAFDKRVSNWLRENEISAGPTEGAGISVMFANMSRQNIHSMLWGIMVAIILVSVLLTICFRSLRIGVISLIVNVLPILVGFGLWGLFLGQAGIAVTIVAAIAFGIVVDDSIHFITKYLAALKTEGGDRERAMEVAFYKVGNALLTTTVVLVTGFMALLLSGFQPSWSMGLLSSLMILVALIYDFTVLPVLLRRFVKLRA